jgi:hypothetical protein
VNDILQDMETKGLASRKRMFFIKGNPKAICDFLAGLQMDFPETDITWWELHNWLIRN